MASQRDAVCRRAQRALQSSSVFKLRGLNVERIGKALVLSGRVESFYHKQLAQELVRSVVSDLDLVNNVAVHKPSPTEAIGGDHAARWN